MHQMFDNWRRCDGKVHSLGGGIPGRAGTRVRGYQ